MRSTQTLVHTPRTAGREDLGVQPGTRQRGAREGAGTPRETAPGSRRVDPLAAELVLGRYSLRERLGAGGFGVVWRARDELLGREVALKRISLPDGDSERASREAQAAARLSHPAIVALYEACAAPDAFYLISELVRGDTLARLIATDALSDARVLQIGIALSDALAHAHARGVIHRDVKPQNVLVPHEREPGPLLGRGAPAVAKLTDFGGARLAGDDVLTRTGDVLGTLAYMAPEQSDGGEVREAADLYSLALILYEAFSGCNPVRGPTPAATARRIGSRLEPLASPRGDLPGALTSALDRGLAPSACERGTLAELRTALAEALEQPGDSAGGRTLAQRRPSAARSTAEQPRPSALESLAHAPPWEAAPPPQRPRGRTLTAPAVALQPAAEAAPRTLRTRARPRFGGAQALPRRLSGPSRRDPPRLAVAPAESQLAPPAKRHAPARAVWIGAAVAAICWQAWSGRAGVALLALAALVPVVMLTSGSAAEAEQHASRLTPAALLAAALAPVLGLVGLAGAFPALAGQASRWRTRAALGALGYWWLTLSEPLLARRLWLGPAAGTPPRAAWEGSLSGSAVHVLGPLLSFGVLLGAALWAAGAVCLPLIVRGRRAALDIVAVTTWSAGLAAAAPMLDAGLSSGAAHASPRGAVLGAVFGALLAVASRALRGPV